MQVLHGACEEKQKEAPDRDCRLLQYKGSQADQTGKVSLSIAKETNPPADDRLRLGKHLGQFFFPVGLLLPHKMHAMVEGRIPAMKSLFQKLTSVQLRSEKPGVLPCSNLLHSSIASFLPFFFFLFYLPFASQAKGEQT